MTDKDNYHNNSIKYDFPYTTISINKSDLDSWRTSNSITRVQKIYRKILPIRFYVNKCLKEYEIKYTMRKLSEQIDTGWYDDIKEGVSK